MCSFKKPQMSKKKHVMDIDSQPLNTNQLKQKQYKDKPVCE